MAKFKIGDKVRHVDDGQDGPVGVVKGVYGDGKIKVKFPGLMKDGFDGFEEEELVMANGCARNAGKAMISRRGNDWYYAWAEGSQDGREGPFRTEEEAIVAAKLDGFSIVNSRAFNSRNPVVAKAMNACGVARNEKYKDFGKSVRGEIDDDGSCFIQIGVDGLVSPFGKNWPECKAKAVVAIKNLEQKAAELKQAVAWFEQNATKA